MTKRKRFARALRARYGVSKGPWHQGDATLDDIFAAYGEVRARHIGPPQTRTEVFRGVLGCPGYRESAGTPTKDAR